MKPLDVIYIPVTEGQEFLVNDWSSIPLSQYDWKPVVANIRYVRDDLAKLTKEDVRRIFDLVRELQTKYSATDGCLQEVADIFNKEREKEIDL